MSKKQDPKLLAFQSKTLKGKYETDGEMYQIKDMAALREEKTPLQGQIEKDKKHEELQELLTRKYEEKKKLKSLICDGNDVIQSLLEAVDVCTKELTASKARDTRLENTIKEHEAAMSCLRQEMEELKQKRKQKRDHFQKLSEKQLLDMTERMAEQKREYDTEITKLKGDICEAELKRKQEVEVLQDMFVEKKAAVQDEYDENILTLVIRKHLEDDKFFEATRLREKNRILKTSEAEGKDSLSQTEIQIREVEDRLTGASKELTVLKNDMKILMKDQQRMNGLELRRLEQISIKDEAVAQLNNKVERLMKERKENISINQKPLEELSIVKQENAKLQHKLIMETQRKGRTDDQKTKETNQAQTDDCKQCIIDGLWQKDRRSEQIIENQEKEIKQLKKSNVNDQAGYDQHTNELIKNMNETREENMRLKNEIPEQTSQLLKFGWPKTIKAKVDSWFPKKKPPTAQKEPQLEEESQVLKDNLTLKIEIAEQRSHLLKCKKPKTISKMTSRFTKKKPQLKEEPQLKKESQVLPTGNNVPDVRLTMEDGYTYENPFLIIRSYSKPVGPSEPDDGLPPVDI